MTRIHHNRLFTNVAMTADRYSPWIELPAGGDANFHVWWAGTGTPVGVIKVELSNDPLIEKELERNIHGASSAAAKVDVTADVDPIYGTGFTVGGGTAGSTMFAFTAGLARYARVWFDYTSGGSAASLANGTVYSG